MSLFTFWAGVAVVGSFYLVHLAGCEYEARQRWQQWERDRRRGVRCPVGDMVGSVHYFRPGSGVVVPWSVLGDSQDCIEVCTECAKGGS